MAAVIGAGAVGAYELALAAAAALTAIFLASPQGQQAARETARKIGELGQGNSSEPDPSEKPDPPPRPPPVPYIPKVTNDCPDKPPDDDEYCKKKWNEINDQLRGERQQPRMGAKGLKQRWLIHACNPGNWSPEGSKAIKHLNEYIKQRDSLSRKIDSEWKNTRCAKKGYQLPPETEKYLDPNKAPVLGSKLDIDGNPIDCSQVSP